MVRADDDPGRPMEDREAFLLQYGKTLSAWATLEFALADWFVFLICAPGATPHSPDLLEAYASPYGATRSSLARSIFYSGRSFETRYSMLLAAVDTGFELTRYKPSAKELKSFLRESLKRARGYSTQRNIIAHHVPIWDTDRQEMRLQRGDRWRHDDGPSVLQLKEAEANFNTLTELLLDALFPQKRLHAMPLQQCLEQLRALPKAAYTDSSGPTRIA